MIYYVTLQTRRPSGFRRKITYFAKELEDAIRECLYAAMAAYLYSQGGKP